MAKKISQSCFNAKCRCAIGEGVCKKSEKEYSSCPKKKDKLWEGVGFYGSQRVNMQSAFMASRYLRGE